VSGGGATGGDADGEGDDAAPSRRYSQRVRNREMDSTAAAPGAVGLMSPSQSPAQQKQVVEAADGLRIGKPMAKSKAHGKLHL
jgi:hypothetical protein